MKSLHQKRHALGTRPQNVSALACLPLRPYMESWSLCLSEKVDELVFGGIDVDIIRGT